MEDDILDRVWQQEENKRENAQKAAKKHQQKRQPKECRDKQPARRHRVVTLMKVMPSF